MNASESESQGRSSALAIFVTRGEVEQPRIAATSDNHRLDFSRLWDEHTHREFAMRDTKSTLATTVDDADVNHIPVLGGGL